KVARLRTSGEHRKKNEKYLRSFRPRLGGAVDARVGFMSAEPTLNRRPRSRAVVSSSDRPRARGAARRSSAPRSAEPGFLGSLDLDRQTVLHRDHHLAETHARKSLPNLLENPGQVLFAGTPPGGRRRRRHSLGKIAEPVFGHTIGDGCRRPLVGF